MMFIPSTFISLASISSLCTSPPLSWHNPCFRQFNNERCHDKLTFSIRPLRSGLDDGSEETKDDNTEEDAPANNQSKNRRIFSTARAGGRSQSSKHSLTKFGQISKIKIFDFLKKLIPALVILTLLTNIFSNNSDGNNGPYFYYESSVYETRSYTSEGKVESTRKESFKSNLPSEILKGRVDDNISRWS